MQLIHEQLRQMGLNCDRFDVLQDKDGILVARVFCGKGSYILKSFQNPVHRREIENYRLLQSLRIPTIRVIDATDSALLLEDLNYSPIYRLGCKEDMNNLPIAEKLAVWYRQLHQIGYDYAVKHADCLYDETDYFTSENIARIAQQTATENLPAWELLQQNFGQFARMLGNARKTLTYNDFYYTNMVVARDGSAAFMFDYNLLGKGMVVSDLRNVTYSLSPAAKDAFLAAYGSFDPLEEMLDDVVSPVVTLWLACQRQSFPNWAVDALQEVKTALPAKIDRLLEMV